jgi:HK97 family phage major capsid protein
MRTLEEIESDVVETRSLYELKKLDKAGVERRLKALQAEKRDIERAKARSEAPVTDAKGGQFRAVAEAMLEKRDITVNGTQAIEILQELMTELQAKTPILQGIRYYYGQGNTRIPVLSPTIATPASYDEGAKDIADDVQANIDSLELAPVAYISELGVTYETRMSAVNIERELPKIFADAFAQGFHTQVLTGSGAGRNMQGIFTAGASAVGANKLTCGAEDAVTIADLVSLATAVQDKTDTAVIILNPATYNAIMGDPTTGVAELYKEELIRDKKLEGIRIIKTSGAPKSMTSGAVIAAALRLEDYAMGIADQLSVTPIRTIKSSVTYYQAVMLANGRLPVQKNLWALTAK